MSPYPDLRPIMLVEDNFDDYEATQRSFKKAKLANPIIWCKTGQDALDYLRGEGNYAGSAQDLTAPCLILLDLNMPGMDGRTALRKIKEDPKLKAIPVIVLTTSSNDRDVELCYDLGANTYIQKPVEFNSLVDAAARLKDYWFGIALLRPET